MGVLSTGLFVISRIPLLIKTIAYHVLSISPESQKWDFRTEVIVTMLRDFLANGPASSISEQQAMFQSDPGVKGPIWASKVLLPAPEDDVRLRLFQVIANMGTGKEQYIKPTLEPVYGEWLGYRGETVGNVDQLSEREKYDSLVRDVQTPATILHFHGGSGYLMDPVSTRNTTSQYCIEARCRLFTIRYRLAPQNPFPSALMDALVAYLSLLYPPKDSFHEPVSPSSIILCGDSHGGNVAMCLMQLLLRIHGSTILFHGKQVAVPFPAGVALDSPSLDLTRSMQADQVYDYLPSPSQTPAFCSPPCDIWPSEPPRADLSCEGSALVHPLVSPMAATSWKGSPPIFISCGEERLSGECRVVAQRAARQGVSVVWKQYEAMPHCFALILTWTAVSKLFYGDWASFVQSVTIDPGSIETVGHFIAAKSLQRQEVDVLSLSSMNNDSVLAGMMATRDAIERRFRNNSA